MLDDLKFEIEEEARIRAAIRIIGVGGCGSNAAAHMLTAGLSGAEFYVVNTDFQALESSPVPNKIAIGARVTHGRGAGGDPEVGKQAALEDTERILEILQGADMVFIVAGMGSGTGTGAAPVVASMARNLGALTVAIVTKPFSFEGPGRMRQAENGLEELAGTVDTVVTLRNDRLLTLAPAGTSFMDGFRLGNEFIRQTVQDLVEIMTTPGVINRDFSDLRATMVGSGYAMLGTATARGEQAALDAARQAIASPLLECHGIGGARNVLLNLTGSSRLGLHDLNEACSLIREAAGSDDLQINFGLVLNESMGDAVKVTIIATGFLATGAPAPREERAVRHERVVESSPGWLSEMQGEAEPAAEPEPEPEPSAQVQPEPEPEPVLAAPAMPEPDYEDELDRPAIERRRRLAH